MIVSLRRRLAERDSKGFTLVELIVVVVILGILTAVAIPSYGAIQHKARVNAVQTAVNDEFAAVSSRIANGQTLKSGYVHADPEDLIVWVGSLEKTSNSWVLDEQNYKVVAKWKNEPSIKLSKTIENGVVASGIG